MGIPNGVIVGLEGLLGVAFERLISPGIYVLCKQVYSL